VRNEVTFSQSVERVTNSVDRLLKKVCATRRLLQSMDTAVDPIRAGDCAYRFN